MKVYVYKVFRWLLKASALATMMFIMQACNGSSFKMELRRLYNEKSGSDTLDVDASEDMQLYGLDDEDWQSGDDSFIP